jgi:hypothetical protein
MAFVTENTTVISFAEYSDVLARDQRLIEANEGLTDDVIEPLLVRATERILTKLRSTSWWTSYYITRAPSGTVINDTSDIPVLNPNQILARQNDFTDLCVYTAFAEFILPLIADFGNEDSSELKKMGYYTNKAEQLFSEIVTAGDWYDFSDDGTISRNEKSAGSFNLKRVR